MLTLEKRNMLKTISTVILCIVFLLLFATRFIALEYSPPGFFVDEAGSAAHIVCLKDTAKNCRGESWTLYSTTWGVGRMGPTHQYAGWAWTEIFGGSIASLRSLSATFGGLTIMTLVYFAYSYAGGLLAICTALSALLLPWGFHASRIAWDPPLAPLFVILAVLFTCKASQSVKRKEWIPFIIAAATSTIVGSLTYTPVMAHLFFLFALLFLLQRYIFAMQFRRWFLLGVICLAGILLFRTADTSAVQGRVGETSIWGNDPRNPTAEKSWPTKVEQFATNTVKHFEPAYLFNTGEYNLRHTTGKFGIFSWLDLFSFSFALILFIVSSGWKNLRIESAHTYKMRKLFLLGFIGYLSATMAAALTWDSIPHALRSLSGWPFAALLSGVCLSYICRFRIFQYITALVCLTFSFYFGSYYFGDFRVDSAWWYDTDVTDARSEMEKTGDKKAFQNFLAERQYPSLAREYHFRTSVKSRLLN